MWSGTNDLGLIVTRSYRRLHIVVSSWSLLVSNHLSSCVNLGIISIYKRRTGEFSWTHSRLILRITMSGEACSFSDCGCDTVHAPAKRPVPELRLLHTGAQ
jgi:hypothetical protein